VLPARRATLSALLTLGLAALFYNFGFFSLLAWSPFPLEQAAHAAGVAEFGAHELGLIFCGWGIALAVTSVFASQVRPAMPNEIPHARKVESAQIAS